MDRRNFLRMGGMTLTGLCLGVGPLATPAWARGAGKEEAERARAIIQQLEAQGAKAERRAMGAGDVCTLAPGGMLHFELHGYCLDHNFSAPAAREPLAFRPMSNYIAPDLRDLYVRVLRTSQSGMDRGADVQKIVWAMRAPAGSDWTRGFNKADRDFLESALPGGTRLVQTANRGSYVAGETQGSRGGGGGGGAGDILGFLLPAIAGQLPYDIRRHSNDLMQQLQQRKARNPMPDSLYCYSMLTESGVAGKGIAVQGLSVRGTVANGSSETFTFDPTRWVMESSRDVQAVALPPPSSINVSKGQPLPQEQKDAKTPDKQDKKSPNKQAPGQGGDAVPEFATEPQS